MSQFIYILNCQYNRKYVGQSPEPARRIYEHLCGSGASFTDEYKPISCAGIFQVPDSKVGIVYHYTGHDGGHYMETFTDIMEDLFCIAAYSLQCAVSFNANIERPIVAGGHRSGARVWDGNSCRKRLFNIMNDPRYKDCLDTFWLMIRTQNFKAESLNRDKRLDWWRPFK